MTRSRRSAFGLVLALVGCSSHVGGEAKEGAGVAATAPPPGSRPAKETPTPEILSKAEVTSRIEAWLAKATTPLRYTPSGGSLTYSSQTRSYRFDQDGVRLLVSFERPLPADSTAAELQQRFQFAVVDEVPLPIQAPGWRVRLMTPQSSTERGLTVESVGDGRLRAKLDWRFFEVLATRSDCQVPADAPMPEECLVSIERDLPFTISFDAAIGG